jgi:serine/threonine protein kinase
VAWLVPKWIALAAADMAAQFRGGGVRGCPPRFTPSAFLARRFRIVRFIARGGMGEVYEAEDVELGEHVALKANSPEHSLRRQFARALQTGDSARAARHPSKRLPHFRLRTA